MVTAESVKAKLQALLDSANAATGNTDADLTAAVNSLIAGYGQGGGDYANEQIAALVEGNATEFVIPDGCKKIKPYFFSNTETGSENPIARVTIPDTVTEIGEYAFSLCSSLKLEELPDSIEIIGPAAFNRVGEGITLAKLPDSLTYIGSNAFYGSGLTIKEIPARVDYIGSGAFKNSRGITELTFKGTPATVNAAALNSSILTINVPWAEDEVAGAPWGATSATINYNYTEEG